MKITVNSIHSIAIWKWNLTPSTSTTTTTATATTLPLSSILSQSQLQQLNLPTGNNDDEVEEEEEDEEEEDVCGICRINYDGCCPDCKIPGDDCPLIWGECTHVFHMHCLLKWLNTDSSKNQCPMDRRIWVTADALKQPIVLGTPIPRPPLPEIEAESEDVILE